MAVDARAWGAAGGRFPPGWDLFGNLWRIFVRRSILVTIGSVQRVDVDTNNTNPRQELRRHDKSRPAF